MLRTLFQQHVAQTSNFSMELEIDRAEGVYMYGSDGKKYMDLISGISVSSVGHSNPKVVKAVKEQAEKHMHLMVYGEMVQAPQVELAKLLTDHLPESLNNVYFVNSGSEATEAAIKVSKKYTGKSEIIHCEDAYHGSSIGALSILGDEYYKRNYRPLMPGTRSIRFNHFEDINQITNRTAAVVIEVIQAEAGILLPKDGYLKAIRKRCDETGTLLVFDEIQTGIFRTGKLYAFMHYEVSPDILLTAKAFGGGMPLGALVSSKEIFSTFRDNPILGHITTFGGHPVCCAAGLASLEFLLENDLKIEEKGKRFETGIDHSGILAKRRKGLFLAIEFEDRETNMSIIDACLQNGMFIDWFLFKDNAMRIAPPLTISFEEIDHAIEMINKSVQSVLKT